MLLRVVGKAALMSESSDNTKGVDNVKTKTMPEICRIFKNRDYKDLIEATFKFNNPLSDNPKVEKMIVDFVDWELKRLVNIRDRSTGRKYVLESEKATEAFGEPLLKKLTAILHILTNQMQGKICIIPTNTFIFRNRKLKMLNNHTKLRLHRERFANQ